MVKERRAFSDEALNVRPPSEELRVQEVPVLDLSSTMNAEYEKAGMWFNPTLFRELAKISNDVHDTRRFSRNMDFQEGLEDVKLLHDNMIKEYENTLKLDRDKNLLDYKLRAQQSFLEAIENAKRNGTSAVDAVNVLIPEFEKTAENIGQTYSSPYMEQAYTSYIQDQSIRYLDKAIISDKQVAEDRSKFTYDKFYGVGLGNMVNGSWTFSDYVDRLPDLFPMLDTITDVDDEESLNKGYNMGFLADVKMKEAALKQGIISPDEFRDYVVAGITKWNKHTLVGKDDQGNKREVEVALSPDTISELNRLVADAKEKRNTSNSVYTAESYLQMTGAEYAKKGEFDKITYFVSTNPTRAREDYMRVRAQLLMDMGAGSESAAKQLWTVDNHYWTVVYPQVAFRDILRKTLATHGNMDSALRDIGNRIIAVKDKLRSGDSLTNVTDLSWTDGTTYLNLNYPDPDQDPVFGDFLRRSGVTDYAARYNFYQSIVEQGEKFLEKAHNTDMLAAMNSTYASALDQVDNTLTFDHLVREDANTGSVVVNESALNEAAEILKKAEIAKRGASGNSIVGTTSSRIISSVTDRAAKLNTKQKAVYFQSVAQVFQRAGVPDAFVNYKTEALTKDQREVARQIGMWSFLNQTPELRALANSVLTNQVGGEEPNPTLADANILTKGRLKNSKEADFSDDVERKLDEYNIPADFRPTLRHTFANMAAAAVSGATKDNNKTFDVNLINKVLDANFTKNGTYKFSSALGGTPPEQVDSNIAAAKGMIEDGLKNLGVNKQITARVDYETGYIKFYADGQPLMGTGTYGPLQGSGIVPFGIKVGAKPVNMPDAKYKDAQASLIAGATMTVALSNVQLNAKLQDIAQKSAGNMKVQDIEKFAYKMMNVINDDGAQEDWYNYYNSNYRNTRVKQAPNEIKKMMLDVMQTYKIGAILGGMGATRFYNPVNQDQLNHFIDFMYTRMQSGNTLRMDVPPSAHFESKGFPYMNIEEQVRAAGWKITSTTDGTHMRGSRHYKGMSSDIGLEGGFWSGMIPGTDLIRLDKLDSLVNGFIKPNNDRGNIKQILTSHKYLISGRVSEKDPRYKAYAKYRNMKTKDGRPLFVYYPDHEDHFHVDWNSQMYDTATGKELNPGRTEMIRNIAHVIETNINDKGAFGYINGNEAKAIATLFYNYKPTDWDVRATGRSISELTDSPITRGLAAAVKFQKGKNALGSANMSVMGMMGATFKLASSSGKSSLKMPDKAFTLEEVIELASKGLSGVEGRGQYRWLLADASNLKRYNETVNRFVRAGR